MEPLGSSELGPLDLFEVSDANSRLVKESNYENKIPIDRAYFHHHFHFCVG